MRALAAIVLASFLAACQEPAPARLAPAPTAAAAAIPAEKQPPPVAAALLKEAVVVEPGERVLPIFTDGPLVVDPGSSFRLVFTRRLPDARLVLLDPDEAFVPAEGAQELSDGSTTLTLKPSRPLVGGGLYTLKVDGAATRELHDDRGNTFQPLSRAVQAAGAPEPEPAPAKAARAPRKKR